MNLNLYYIRVVIWRIGIAHVIKAPLLMTQRLWVRVTISHIKKKVSNLFSSSAWLGKIPYLCKLLLQLVWLYMLNSYFCHIHKLSIFYCFQSSYSFLSRKVSVQKNWKCLNWCKVSRKCIPALSVQKNWKCLILHQLRHFVLSP